MRNLVRGQGCEAASAVVHAWLHRDMREAVAAVGGDPSEIFRWILKRHADTPRARGLLGRHRLPGRRAHGRSGARGRRAIRAPRPALCRGHSMARQLPGARMSLSPVTRAQPARPRLPPWRPNCVPCRGGQRFTHTRLLRTATHRMREPAWTQWQSLDEREVARSPPPPPDSQARCACMAGRGGALSAPVMPERRDVPTFRNVFLR
jgi:hypothetical protein